MLTAVNAPFSDMRLNVGSIGYGLAHLAMESQKYREYLGTQKKYWILDNGADELGTGMTGEDLFGLTESLRPSELILPDVLKEKDATFEATTEFYSKYYAGKASSYRPKFMAVAQGKTYDEFIASYSIWHESDFVDVIGIPYDIDFDVPVAYVSETMTKTQKRAVRRRALVGILSASENSSRKPVHLLGMNSLLELSWQNKITSTMVRSHDTTGPFAAAVDGKDWLKMGLDFEKDWPALDFDYDWKLNEYSESAKLLAYRNLYTYLSVAHDTQALFNLGVVFRDDNLFVDLELDQEDSEGNRFCV